MFINGINNFQYSALNPKKQAFKGGNEVHVRTLSTNDIHGSLIGFRKVKTEVDRFRAETPKDIVSFVVDAGDSSVGANEKKNETIVEINNAIAPDEKSPGNHEFDQYGTKGYSKLLDKAKYQTLALNLIPKQNCALQDDIDAGRLAKSNIIERNGKKFGFIGLIPTDLKSRINLQCKENSEDVDILDLPETIKAVQKEVEKLEAQNVNMITVVSHLGYDSDVELAKNVVGIDVINGGHSHDIIDGVVAGKNFFMSKRGEPVLITQTGKNGHNVGITDIVYDNKGRIIKAKNEIKSIEKTPENLLIMAIENHILGHPQEIGIIAQDAKAIPEYVLDEAPINSFLCDGYRKYTGAQIAFNNTGSIRNSFKKGPVTDRQIMDILPYYNPVHIYKLSEKDIMDALNGAIGAARQYQRTGALQVSGMRYTIGKNDKVKDVYLVKDDGTEEKMNSENPSSDKFFTVTYNTFLAGGTEGLQVLKAPEKIIGTCEKTETDILKDYIASFNHQPITIAKMGRIIKED